MTRGPGRVLRIAVYVGAALTLGCSSRAIAPSRAPRAPAPAPVATSEPPPADADEPEPTCEYDDHYDAETSFFVSLEPVARSGLSLSRFHGREEGACGDAMLVLESNERGSTLTAVREGKSSTVFRDATDFVLLEGCVDLTGDGAPELVLRRPGTAGASTEVVALEAAPRTLLKVPFELELRKTRHGPFPYELVSDDAIVYTEPQLPVVFAYREARFERIGSKDTEYWRARRELLRRALECYPKTNGPRAFVNLWFSASLYVGDWDDERKAFDIDPVQLLELELARPLFGKELDGMAKLPPLPSNVWLASKGAPAEITRALGSLTALLGPPKATASAATPLDDPSTSLPPGSRNLALPEDGGTLLERCGTYVVEQVGDEVPLHVRLRDAGGNVVGRIVPAVNIGHAAAEWCFDLTGDGVPELLVTESSGGAHCCSTYRVISLGPKPALLLDFAAGDGLLEGAQDLDGKGALELVGRDDVLMNEASASPFAGTYLVPIVFSFENGKYVRKTRRFKKFLEQERTEIEASYREDDANGVTDDPSGWMALSVLIGDFTKVKGRLPIEPASRAWFDPEGTLARIERGIER
ncbi:MAG TPA: hypothetical protein VFZ53_23305 [Polyangiaceae bacterium]